MPGAVRNRISIINVPAKNAAYVKSSHFDTKKCVKLELFQLISKCVNFTGS